ncbi:MAG: NADPH:quinone oxidoreductase family protein [Pseudomonadota bacterium]
MKTLLCKSLDGPDALEVAEIDPPMPEANQVIVRVRAVGLNFLDTLMTRGKYQFKPPLPFSPGGEIAGEVLAIGSDVQGYVVGDKVCAFVSWGGAREQMAVDAGTVIKMPEGVDDVTAAGISVTYGTAMHGLRDRGRLQSGETVAVLGASGGAGLAAVEIAKLMGARVIAAASSAEKLDVCQQHGADDVLNYSETDVKEGLRALTDGRGVDVIYDCVGGPYAEPALRAIAWMGRYLVIGFAAGDIPKFPINLMLLKSCDVVGVFWGQEVVRNPGQHRENMEQVLRWVSEGKLKPHVHATYPLEETGTAIRLLDQRIVKGKVIVTV